jgi:hypothetical protein
MKISAISALLLSSLLAAGISHAESRATARESSQRIAEAVEAFKPLAGSGVEVYQVIPGSAKQMLLELALQEQIIDSAEDFELSSGSDVWEADSLNWGLEMMKGAYSYITAVDQDQLKEMTPKERARLEQNLKAAKAAFPLLMNTGVQFGVVPMGAVQCGVRFQALAILDVKSGKIYVFAREGSGC